MDHVRGCLLYRDKNGKEPVNEYLQDLARQKGKDSRIKLNKIRDYVKALSLYGTTVGEPYMKHLEGEIWELRPIRDRILFVAWRGNKFLLLHHFMKKTQKTPRREIEQAKRNLADFIARSKENE
ncbi:MAG: type II toxin-antitoxin system RelE/ParE family toxin [Tannerella sp.]|nr:type II toxin-antitoxin system RelE/ParE family toxin [Tannerella sp.]